MDRKSLGKGLQWSFSIGNFVSSGFLLTLVFFLMNLFSRELQDSIDAIIIGIVLGASTFIIVYFMDKNPKLSNLTTIKRLNLKWLVIAPTSVIISIIGFVVFISLADINFQDILDTDLTNTANLDFIAYSLMNIVTTVVSYLLYFGIKNIPKVSTIKMPQFPFFAAFSLIFIIASSYGMFFVFDNYYYFPDPTIVNGNGHTDGPWLTWDDDPTSTMTISWLTENSNSTVVRYGETPGNLDQTYAVSTQVNMHHAQLTGLSPDTTYYYKIPEEFEQDHYSNLFNFTTTPTSASPRAFKCAVYGDVQPTNQEYVDRNQLVADGLIKGDFDFILQTGDLADSGNDLNDWHMLFESFARVGATTPIQAAIGNHDWDGSSGSSNWAEAFPYDFPQPKVGRHYSFDYLDAHFIMIDNFEHIYSMSSPQLNWIETDIQNARSENPDCWVFCFFHLSMMTTATSGHYYNVQRQLIPIFDKNDVDAVFYGHDHHYEHYNYTYGVTNPGRIFEPDHDWDHNEIQYFCTGGGGANLEVSYGVLENKMYGTDEFTWWNETAGEYETDSYEITPWNSTRYVQHAGWEPNYTTPGSHSGKYYYHEPSIENYNEYATEIGFDYGEQCYQYMQIEINSDGSECTISARYPNGVLISGPGGIKPQSWTLTKD